MSRGFKARIDDSVFSYEVQCNFSFLYRSFFDNPEGDVNIVNMLRLGVFFSFSGYLIV